MKKKKHNFFGEHPVLRFICKTALIFILFSFFVYALFGFLLFTNAKNIQYFENDEEFYDCQDFYGFSKENVNGTRFFYNRHSTSDKILVYYHGNAGTACDRSYLTGGFSRIGTSMIFVEYSGYANDSRSPSRELLLQDVENVNQFIKEQNITQIAAIGESLGSATASYHAFIEPNVYSVVLLAPFESISKLARDKYSLYPFQVGFDEYDNGLWLENYEGRLVIIHGSLDENIPIKHAKNLYEKVPSKDKYFLEHKNAEHNNLYQQFNTYRAIRAGVDMQNLDEFILLKNN